VERDEDGREVHRILTSVPRKGRDGGVFYQQVEFIVYIVPAVDGQGTAAPQSRVIPIERDGFIRFDERPLDYRQRQSVPLQYLIIEHHQYFAQHDRPRCGTEGYGPHALTFVGQRVRSGATVFLFYNTA